ncbi:MULTISPECIES: hypothetical protein [Micromonospora]|uniref:Uncharacterized protein n=1 Tax=Micromonospora solifontis TaxID=2487138 RepID=A0ABX9WPG0_9ACTN|nr:MULTISPECIES: hypothetical protein [Micromonospora]NES14627.1 hypothetical protein [Micromonospora sp. PPF5-17B]NES35235.1 hypothetical protein [Micromonospora solifontis]NES58405.1 hypothetical protein [Micromonospora sp. PPF5-6]RNM00967.1 hypothetical protein EFE23_03515 [Micromonospora solifontis]
MWISRRRWRLLVVAAVPVMAEVGLLYLVGFRPTPALAVQVTSLWPIGTYHDLRWVLVYHRSWPGFALELGAALVARGLLSAALTALAWPEGNSRPTLPRLVGRHLRFAAVVAAALLPWTAMSVLAAEVSLSWLVFLAVLPVLLLVPLFSTGGMVGRWWRAPRAEVVGLGLLGVLLATAWGMLLSAAPSWAVLPVAGLAGASNGLLWQRMVTAALRSDTRRADASRWEKIPVAPAAAVLLLALIPFAGGRFAAAERRAGEAPPATLDLPILDSTHRPVIFVAGYNSYYQGASTVASNGLVHYSYRGIDQSGRPRPYVPYDTRQSLVTSAQLLAVQLHDLRIRTGHTIALLAESEGSLIVRYYLEHLRQPWVDAVALTSPIVRSGRVYYPPPGQRTGWGVATGWQLRLLFRLAGRETALGTPDEPFLRSLLDNAPLYRSRTLCPVDGVRMVAFLPTADAFAVAPGTERRIAVVDVLGFHGLLVDRPEVQRLLADFLTGAAPLPVSRADYSILNRIGAEWLPPSLLLRLNPVWNDGNPPDAALSERACVP